jgi:glycolate oxidase iron-sulfur subunit
LGRESEARVAARRQIDAWTAEIEGEGLDAILVTASGCGTTVKDYGFMFRSEPEPWKSRAGTVAGLTLDVTEFLTRLGYSPTRQAPDLAVAYHSACSLQHGQQVTTQPKALLARAGFRVTEPREPHICCGSAGTYNMLQPEIAGRLRARKLDNLKATTPDLIAAGNIGCITQLSGDAIPVVHTVELLDWMAGGPRPPGVPG